MAATKASTVPTMMMSTPRSVGLEGVSNMIAACPRSDLEADHLMKAPMLIHTRPPSPVTISRSSVKKVPMYLGFSHMIMPNTMNGRQPTI